MSTEILRKTRTTINQSEENVNGILDGMSALHSSTFAEAIWTSSGGDHETIQRITDLFDILHGEERDAELFTVIRILHGVVGIVFPACIQEACNSREAKSVFLQAFVLDFAEHVTYYLEKEEAIE